MALLEASKLTIGYDRDLVGDISFTCQSGELLALVGRNGQGKTTLFKTLAGLLAPRSGSVTIDSKDLASWSVQERAKHLSLVFTERHALGGFDVRGYVALGRHPYRKPFAPLSSEDNDIISQAIEATGLSHLTNRTLDRLSDGERQRASLARALTQQTPIIFLDEPTAFLDYPGKMEIMQYLKKMSQEEGKLVIFSTHELPLINNVVDGALHVDKGNFQHVRSDVGKKVAEWFGIP